MSTTEALILGDEPPAPPKIIKVPFTIAIDTREQLPYSFVGIRADSDKDYAILEVPTMRTGLPIGDYLVLGLPQAVIERKSKEDLYASVSQRRDNFEQRLCRMQEELRWAAVVIEASWHEVITQPPTFTQFNPKSLNRTLIAWMQRFPRVHWCYLPNRDFAERHTFRCLERWWKDHRHDADMATL